MTKPWRVTLLTIPPVSQDQCVDFNLIRMRDIRTGRQTSTIKSGIDKWQIRKSLVWAGAYSSLLTKQEV
jgi:hypothetical protein